MRDRIQAQYFVKEFEDIASQISRALSDQRLGTRKRRELTSELHEMARRIDELKRKHQLP